MIECFLGGKNRTYGKLSPKKKIRCLESLDWPYFSFKATMTCHVTTPLPTKTCKVIIVGGGCYGLSTAYALSLKQKQYDVWVFDRLPIPVNDAASTDINKTVRMDYADKTLYMQLMIECLPMWRQWNEERASMGLDPVYYETGVLSFARGGQLSEYERQCLDQIRQVGFGHAVEELTGEMIIDKFPSFLHAVSNGYNVAYFNKEGGWCHSSEAIKHLYDKCRKNGVHFILGDEGCFEELYLKENGTTVQGIRTKDGKVHGADRVILATGSWTSGLIDTSNQLTATGQVVIQFRPPEEMAEELKHLPVWAADVSRSARHSAGYLNPRQEDQVSVPRTKVSHVDDTIPIGAVRGFRRLLKDFLPQTDGLDIVDTRLCWYSDTSDGDFLITPHPTYQNLIIASGDSGHAMKFLPILGFKIAEVIEGIKSEYTCAWAWRTTGGLRGDGKLARPVLNDKADEETRLAATDELRAGSFQ
ncbi:hypothetical protein EC973_007359 [Apophysomyces ossiformis]|uniref:FAD dependent oxidoreductase domain-containing protein n=1 Tax=Apophysomyces ossiformis TaxID=679940 RepID=A0A8H7BUU3_9FUNG|nr:hypothetical protein EC973_007359 [Apophysomyces ossiformis]